MSNYEVDCEWDGYSWIAKVVGIPGAVTQGKRLDLLPDRIVEVVKLMTDETISSDEITLSPRLGG